MKVTAHLAEDDGLHRPVQLACRFSRNAAIPSWASAASEIGGLLAVGVSSLTVHAMSAAAQANVNIYTVDPRGLIGMIERVNLLGGTCEAGPDPTAPACLARLTSAT